MEVEKIKNIVVELLSESQFLVDVQVNNANNVSVYVDDLNGLSVASCRAISRGITANFDRDIDDFGLEVSSPGLDKPFKVIEQYHKNIDKKLLVLMVDGIKHEGVLKNVDTSGIGLEVEKVISPKKAEKGVIKIDFESIKKANIKLDY